MTPAGPECGHSACRQHWIDTGDAACIEDADALPWDDDDPPPRNRGWGLRFTDKERDDLEGME